MKSILATLCLFISACGSDPTQPTPEPRPTVAIGGGSFTLPSCDVHCRLDINGLPPVEVVVPLDMVAEFAQSHPEFVCGQSLCSED